MAGFEFKVFVGGGFGIWLAGAVVSWLGLQPDVEQADTAVELFGDRMVLASPAGRPGRIDRCRVMSPGDAEFADRDVVGKGGHPAGMGPACCHGLGWYGKFLGQR